MARRRGSRVPFVIVVLLASVAAVVLNTPSRRGRSFARVTIPPGATIATAADSLARVGLVRSALVLRAVVGVSGRGGESIVPGRYMIPRGASHDALLTQLHEGRGRYRRITIPEGWGILQIARVLRDSLAIPEDSLRAATRDSARRLRMQTSASDVEGYLFPATYEFADGITAAGVVDTMLLTFGRRWKPAWDTAIAAQGRTRHEVVTLASIVEKEAVRADERVRIASVYLNRLRTGMRLQADPTVLYAMGLTAKRVLFADLSVDSPYNTYRVAGLPPGPIASPGTASLAAAVTAGPTDELFFVSFPDGHSEFTRSFAAHTAAVGRMRAARRAGTATTPSAASTLP